MPPGRRLGQRVGPDTESPQDFGEPEMHGPLRASHLACGPGVVPMAARGDSGDARRFDVAHGLSVPVLALSRHR